jgi:hypothetical protein
VRLAGRTRARATRDQLAAAAATQIAYTVKACAASLALVILAVHADVLLG